MVAHLGMRTHELLFEEIGIIIADVSSAWEKAECYEEVANHSQRIFTLIKITMLQFFILLNHTCQKTPKIIILHYRKVYMNCLPFLQYK